MQNYCTKVKKGAVNILILTSALSLTSLATTKPRKDGKISLFLTIFYFFGCALKHFYENIQIMGKYFNRVFIASIREPSLADKNSARLMCVDIDSLPTWKRFLFHESLLSAWLI